MKRLFCLILLLAFAAALAGCGRQEESSAQPGSSGQTTEPSAVTTSENPTEAPAKPEDLLAWGGKTLSGYGADWAALQGFKTAGVKAADGEDAECASCSFAFSDSAEKCPGITVNGSIYFGRDASVLFDIPEEVELDPLAEGFLAEQVKALLPEAKEETKTAGSTVWNIRSFCREAQEDGYTVYDLIAWSDTDGVLAYVNASAVRHGAAPGEKAAETVSGLLQEWFSSLEIR